MLPLLEWLADGQVHKFSDTTAQLAKLQGLTEDQCREMLDSGSQTVVHSRIGWAKSYMKQAGLLMYPRRGFMQITERGQQVLAGKPQVIDKALLAEFTEFREFIDRKSDKPEAALCNETQPQSATVTPDEQIQSAYNEIRDCLAEELLTNISSCSPAFFEQLVVDLMLKMGYGGSRREAGKATQLSADGGIDGVIHEDRLGLDSLYLQAKRWEGTVGRPEIQKFAGALQGEGAHKGVFITTSGYSKEARLYADRVNSRIVLIDGQQLAQLMIDFGLGVSTRQVYEIKQIDSDYFEEL